MKNIKLFFFFTIVVLSMACSPNYSKIIVGEFDSGNVTLQEAIAEYNSISDDQKENYVTSKDFFRIVRKVALIKIILKKVKQDNNSKLDNEFDKKIDQEKKQIAFDLLYKNNVTDKVTIKDRDYKKYQKQYELYQIVKRKDIKDDSTVKKSKKLLKQLSKSITSFEDFKEAAKKYSDDVSAKDGGYVGFVRLGIMEDEIDKVMSTLKVGKISSIIETSLAYHIIYINSIKHKSINEVKKDKQLEQDILKQKSNKQEKLWYDNLLDTSGIKINFDLLKEKKYDDAVVIKYKDKIYTRNDIFKTADSYSQGVFPDPTLDELKKFVRKMALELIIKNMINEPSIVNSSEYKGMVKQKIDTIIVKNYIDSHISIPKITDKMIDDFYNVNKNTLFTFKQDNGALYIQPKNEVIKFIKEKIDKKLLKETKYKLYRILIKEANFKTTDKLEFFQKYVNKIRHGKW